MLQQQLRRSMDEGAGGGDPGLNNRDIGLLKDICITEVSLPINGRPAQPDIFQDLKYTWSIHQGLPFLSAVVALLPDDKALVAVGPSSSSIDDILQEARKQKGITEQSSVPPCIGTLLLDFRTFTAEFVWPTHQPLVGDGADQISEAICKYARSRLSQLRG